MIFLFPSLLFADPLISKVEGIYNSGSIFLQSYEEYLRTGNTYVLFHNVESIKDYMNLYQNSEDYKILSNNSRDFRETIKRIKIDIEQLEIYIPREDYGQVSFFSTDLCQTLHSLYGFKTGLMAQTQNKIIDTAIRIGLIVLMIVAFIVIAFLFHTLRLKNRLLTTKIESKKNEAFALAVFQAQEEERQRISNELHDTIAQEIRGIRLKAETGDAKQVANLSTHCMNELRAICYNLMPPDLKLENSETRIENLLHFLCKNFQEQQKIKCTFSSEEKIYQIKDQKILLNLFRMVQEALNNVAKHSYAEHCSVIVKNSSQGEGLVIYITDDGKGFNVEENENENTENISNLHYGLKSMKSRANLIGASVEIESEIDDGTEIRIEYKK